LEGAAAETKLRTGKAAAKTIEGAEVEAGQRDSALLIAERLLPGGRKCGANLPNDRVEELGRVEEIGDHIQADAFKEIIKTGQGFDRLRRAMFWSSAAMRAETVLAAV